MGWQKDEIEDLAEELGIDDGGSLSQQDRLRYISRQVGMNDFNGISNEDTDELQRRLEERRMQNGTNSNNNSSNRTNSSSNLNNRGNSSNRSNSFNNRRNFGKNSDSGVSDSLRKNNANRNARRQSLASNNNKKNNSSFSKKNSDNNDNSFLASSKNNYDVDGESNDSESGVIGGKISKKIPLSTKISIIGCIVVVFIVFFLIFSVIALIVDLEFSSSASAPYEPSCTKVTVKYCKKEDGKLITNWSDVPSDYESGKFVSVDECFELEEVEMDFEKYVERVVAAEVGGFNNMEVYKALAVAARTYALNSVENCSIRSSTKNQVAIYGEPNSKVKQAVSDTYHEVLLTRDESKEDGVTLAASIEYDAFKCVDKDDEYYYMSQPTLDDAGVEEGDRIPIEWAHKNASGYIDKDTNEIPCAPVGVGTVGGHGRGMSQYGALYFMEINPDATYTDILMHYYGKKIVIFSCDVFDEDTTLSDEEIREDLDEIGIDEESDLGEFASAYKSCGILGNLTN